MAHSAASFRQEVSNPPGRGFPWGGVLAGTAAAAGILGTVMSVREANKNRAFQEKMSSTAHQREVVDLQRAGLNPAISAHGGASTPSGNMAEFGEMSRAVGSALAVKQVEANIGLTRASEYATIVGAEKTRAESSAITPGGQIFRQRELDIGLSELNLGERRNLFAPVIAGAWASIGQMQSAARASAARAALDEFATRGAMNARDVEELISKFPEWTRLFGPVLSKLVTGAAGGAAAGAILRKPVSPKTVIIRR